MLGPALAWPNGGMSRFARRLPHRRRRLPARRSRSTTTRSPGASAVPTGGRGARVRVLAANGIRTRHYALDERGETTMLNEELAAAAVTLALKDRGLAVDEVTMLATGTTQGDLLVPGFASMVHGRLGGGPMELLSAGGVCASSMAALRAAAAGGTAGRARGGRRGRIGARLPRAAAEPVSPGHGHASTPSSCAGRSPTAPARSCCEPHSPPGRAEPAAGLDAPRLPRARAPGVHVAPA